MHACRWTQADSGGLALGFTLRLDENLYQCEQSARAIPHQNRDICVPHRCCHLVSHFKYMSDKTDRHHTDALRLSAMDAARRNKRTNLRTTHCLLRRKTRCHAQLAPRTAPFVSAGFWKQGLHVRLKVAHTRLPSVGYRSWSRFLAVSLQVTWVINPAVGCHYFPPRLQLPSQPLRGLLPISLLDEQRHDGCEQFAWDCYPTASRLRFEPGPFCAWVQHANHSAIEQPTYTYDYWWINSSSGSVMPKCLRTATVYVVWGKLLRSFGRNV